MPHTLRRKMFRLGGEVNTHGVGLTSGLNYNGGGSVAPIGQVGKGPLQMKGPDGKMREMQNPLALLRFLLPGVFSRSTAGGLGALGRGWKGLKRFYGPRRTRSRYDKVIKGKPEVLKRGAIGPPRMLPDRTISQMRYDPLTWGQRGGQAARVLGTGLGLGTGAGLGSAALTRMGMPPDDVEGQSAVFDYLNPIRRGAEHVADFGTYGVPLAQGLFRPAEDIQSTTELISGRDRDAPGPETLGGEGDGSEVMKTALTQEEEFAAMKKDADARAKLYYDMLSEGPDKGQAIANMLMTAGANWDEDKAAAIAAGGQEITKAMTGEQDIKDQAMAMAIDDVVGESKRIDEAKLAILSDPSLSASQSQDKIEAFTAYKEHKAERLPLDPKTNEPDPEKMDPGVLYFDYTNQHKGYWRLEGGKPKRIRAKETTV